MNLKQSILDALALYLGNLRNTFAPKSHSHAWSGITGKPSTFAPSTHNHTKSQITDFPTSLKNPQALTLQVNGTTKVTYTGATAGTFNITPGAIGAAKTSHGTHVSYGGTPVMDGAATAGSATTVARSDHRHPTDTSRAAASHTHNYAAASHGTHVSYSSTKPLQDGTASVGSASTVARSDHRHPTDTSRAAASHTHNYAASNHSHTTLGTSTSNTYIYGYSRMYSERSTRAPLIQLMYHDGVDGEYLKGTNPSTGTAYLSSPAAYNTKSTAAANVRISSTGIFGLASSASRYKLDIQNMHEDESYPYNILKLNPKQWFDKAGIENYSRYLADKYNGVVYSDPRGVSEVEAYHLDDAPTDPIYGLIAEDVEAAGLSKFCDYAYSDDETEKRIEGIQYDRLPILMIPILRDIVVALQKVIPAILASDINQGDKEYLTRILEKFNYFNQDSIINMECSYDNK